MNGRDSSAAEGCIVLELPTPRTLCHQSVLPLT